MTITEKELQDYLVEVNLYIDFLITKTQDLELSSEFTNRCRQAYISYVDDVRFRARKEKLLHIKSTGKGGE
jgi:hypothetical protein